MEPALVDVRVDLARLLPNETSGQTVFLVDDTQQITIVLTANIELTSVSIGLPESGTITPENVGMEYGGSFRGFSVGSNPPSACHVLPLMCEPGHHYHFEFPSQGPGEYTILYEAPSGLGGASDAGVLIRMLTDSLIGVATLVLPTSAKVDSPVTIAVIVLDGTGVEGATANAFVRKESAGSYTTVSLLDDGEDADAEADDGIYSGVYTPTEVGNYEVAVTVTGTSRSFDFERHSGSSFTVYDPPAEFSAPLAVSDAGTDTDDPANGLYNRLDIGVEVDVHQAGDYILTAVLEAADESVLIALGEAELEQGTGQTLTASVEAEGIRELTSDGIFLVKRLELRSRTETQEGDRIERIDVIDLDPAYETESYTRSEFERPPIVLRFDAITSVGLDTDDPEDELFNFLRFTIPIDLLNSGTYYYSAALVGRCGEHRVVLGVAGGELEVLSSFTNPVDFVFDFPGEPIAAVGVGGTYSLENLTIYGAESLIGWEIAETAESYTASQFQGWTELPDCDENETADVCDIAADPARDCDYDGVLDDCTPAVTGACCDPLTGSCIDVALCACTGTFHPGEECGLLEPPCPTPPEECGPSAGCCFAEHGSEPGCNDVACCVLVCLADDWCCDVGWDSWCVDGAVELCEIPSCLSDPADACIDCNENGVPDACDLSLGTSTDCDENGIPDECQAPITGACCDADADGVCADDVSICDCAGRFEAEETCANLDPPCEWACCDSEGDCEDLTAADCETAGGVLRPGASCLDTGFTCPTCSNFAGCCYQGHGQACCSDPICSVSVCLRDSFCCDVVWDAMCAAQTTGMNCSTTCVAYAPAAPPAPQSEPKNRYVSFAPNNGPLPVAFRITKVGESEWSGWVGSPNANGIAQIVGDPEMRIWTESVIHVGDCAIVPVAEYQVSATADEEEFSDPLDVSTIEQPSGGKYWGDTVGSFNGSEWSGPNGIVNANDFLAALQKFQRLPQAPHLTWVDVQSVSSIDPCLNYIVNIADVFILIQAFQGAGYPFTTNPASCPSECPEVPIESFGPESSGIALSVAVSPYQIDAEELVTVRVFVDSVDDLAAFETALLVTPTEGATGTLTLETVTVNTADADFVFYSQSIVSGANLTTANAGAARTAGTGHNVTGPKYLATYEYRASAGAEGIWEVTVDESAYLLDGDALLIESSAGNVGLIRVGLECTATTHCADGNQCTDDVCDSGECSNPNSSSSTPCDDGLFCTATDLCDGNGACAGTGSPCTQFFPLCCEDLDLCKASNENCWGYEEW